MAYVSKGWGRKYVGCKDGRKSGRLELFEELVDQDKDWDVEEEHSVNSWELRASQFDYGGFSYCPVCYEWFDNQLAMLMHGVCHLWLPQIRRVCKKCQWVATRKIKTAYYHHSVRKHPKRFRWCQPCQLVFIVKKDHADHLRTHDKGYTGRVRL
ncbi:hypothetical protein C8Q75DRAFT_119590 [Abortiporus biennis]|nr:hypothetical protein C8Q75DRAFT_119590 [Abortiporus biennis]